MKSLDAWGVPEFEGFPKKYSRYMDQSSKIPGKETEFNVYEIRGVIVGIYKIKGKVYAVTLDRDHREPLDLALVDPDGEGVFEKRTPDRLIPPPWTFEASIISPKSEKDIKFGEMGQQAALINPYKNPDAVIAMLEPYSDRDNIDSAIYFLQLGIAYQVNKKTVNAMTIFKRGLVLAPDNSELNLNLGISYTWNGDYDLAMKQFKLYKKLQPKSERADKWIQYIVKKIR